MPKSIINNCMAKFREWLVNDGLLTEDGFAGAGGNSWDVLYPTYADDYAHVAAAPLDHQWLQWKWSRGLELGRKLVNIDNEEFQKRGYVGIESRDMPSAGDKGWKHKKDDGRGSAQPYKIDNLLKIAIGKTSNQTKLIDWDNDFRSWTAYGGSTEYEPDCDLRSIFGDDHEHKWPEIDEKYMDAPFKNKYE